MQSVNPKQISVALSETSGIDFELFVQKFYPAASGIEFIPLGGMKDGGGDGYDELSNEGVYEGKKHHTFYQITVQENHRSKIRSTVKRLREFGRDPRTVTYITSRFIPNTDVEVDELSEELNVIVRIRDKKYIENNINKDMQTISAFSHHLFKYLEFTEHVGGTHMLRSRSQRPSSSVFVFLQQELERRNGKSSLLDATADSLILWALEGTDPDKKILMTADEITRKIEGEMPTAKHFLRGSLSYRLKILSSKSGSPGREIKHHHKEKGYCLPYEVRKSLAQDNEKDEALRTKVLDRFTQRAADELETSEDAHIAETIARIATRAVQITFEKEGINFASFLSSDDPNGSPVTVADNIDTAIDEFGLNADIAKRTKPVALKVLRGAFYASTREERLYFSKLCRTYALLFAISSDPETVNYFQAMATNLYLVVGTDLLIRALSERHLSEEDQMTSNLLKILSDAGSKLVLSEPIFDEVYSHICNSDRVFKNDFSRIEHHINLDISSQSKMILVRAYFYAKFGKNVQGTKLRSWGQYIGHICDYADLHTGAGKEQIRNYMIAKFGLHFEDKEELLAVTNEEDVNSLFDRLKEYKKKEVLAYNDALIVNYVFGRRNALGERSKVSKYGYRTWWLTHEATVRKHTKDIVAKKGGQYIMRPEFLLNFISLAPSSAEVRETYKNIFPTLLGIRLAERMKDNVFDSMIKSVNEANQYDDARVLAKTQEMTNQLIADLVKQYDRKLSAGSVNDPF